MGGHSASLIAGAFAGGIEAICVWPTENVKTQLQLQGKVANPKFTSFSGGVKFVMRTQGFRGLYTGLTPILIGAFPKVRFDQYFFRLLTYIFVLYLQAGIKFGSNSFFKENLKQFPLHRSVVDFVGGLGAGALEAVFASVPIETVKTKTIEV